MVHSLKLLSGGTVGPNRQVTILCVDDREDNLIALEAILSGPEYRIINASSGHEALMSLSEHPDLILMDVQMPIMDGFETARMIRETDAGKNIPIIFLTAIHRDELHLKQALFEGAVDYLYKPINPEILKAKIRVFVDLFNKQHELEIRAQELEHANSHLRSIIKKSEKLQADKNLRSRFVATIVHDLRNPIAAAKMSLHLFKRKFQALSADQANTILDRLAHSIDRMDQMAETLLDAKRVEAGQPLPINRKRGNLNALLDKTISDLNAIHGDRIRLQVDQVYEFSFGSDAIQRAIENLIVNAIKYGSQSDPITVNVQNDGHDTVTLSVHNFGSPIRTDELDRIFEPFQRSHTAQRADTKGWGLGLFLVQAIASAHGGSVSAQSSEELGTIFQITLPLHSSNQSVGLTKDLSEESLKLVGITNK